jgi:hypothetical protein
VPVKPSPRQKLHDRDEDKEFILLLGANHSVLAIILKAFSEAWLRLIQRLFRLQGPGIFSGQNKFS